MRTGEAVQYAEEAAAILEAFAAEKKSYVMAQCIAKRRAFERMHSPKLDEATVNEAALKEFEEQWSSRDGRFAMIPGKEALAAVNVHLQAKYEISLTPTAIVDAMRAEEVLPDMVSLIRALADFARLESRI